MNRLGTIAFIGILVGYSLTAVAQQPITVAAVLDGGGKKLTKDEALKLFAGATLTGARIESPTTTYKQKFLSDGTTTGTAWYPGGSTEYGGTWLVNDLGQCCSDMKNTAGAHYGGCYYYFVLNSRYYSAKTDERWQPVYERQFTR
jgi:hypothetical protein